MNCLKKFLRIKTKKTIKETTTAIPQLERAMLPKVEMRPKRGDK